MPYVSFRLSFCSEDLPVREEDGCWGDVHAADPAAAVTSSAAGAVSSSRDPGSADRLPSSVPSPIDQSKIDQLLGNVDYGSSNNDEPEDDGEEEEEDDSRAKEDILAGEENSRAFDYKTKHDTF